MQTISTEVRPHRFTVDEYHKMGESGIFYEDDRVELIEGEIIDMAPIGSPHASTVARLVSLFSAALAEKVVIFPQNPVRLGKRSEPQPDIALLRPRSDFYQGAHPTPKDVLLLIEVSDTTLRYDRDRKIPLYARHRIPEVWLIDLQGERVEIYRQPSPEGYRQILRPARSEKLTPVLLPQIAIPVGKLLPQ